MTETFRPLGDIVQAVAQPALERLQPIPTVYRGITYRSRLEARWAVFFDAIGATAEYEPEGYQLGRVRYLPDFLIRAWDLFIEVKPFDPSEIEAEKCGALSRASGRRVLMVIGPPSELRGRLFPSQEESDGLGPPEACGLARCRRCPAPVITYRGEAYWSYVELLPCGNPSRCGDRWPPVGNDYEDAIIAASNARFGEHRKAAE